MTSSAWSSTSPKAANRWTAAKPMCGAADVYVIIVAWRFGYVPGRTASPPDGRSISEIELQEAQASGRPVLAFLLDPEAPWPPNRVDAMGGAHGTGEDVSRLRALLGTDYLAGIFRTPDDLASQVAAAVSAQGLTRHMVDRVLGETSVATPDMNAFAQGNQVSDTISIKQMIQRAGAARALVLQIDEGQRWWSTRLFLLASLLRSLTSVRQVVFCDTCGWFVGMASPVAIIDGLAKAFPDLDEFARRLRQEAPSVDIERETDRQINAWNAFLSAPPLPPGGVSPNVPPQSTGIDESTLKVGVRGPLLERWLGERWVGRCIRVDSYDLSMNQVQQIVDSLLPDVPIQRPKKDLEYRLRTAGRRSRRIRAPACTRVGALRSAALASALTHSRTTVHRQASSPHQGAHVCSWPTY